MYHTTHLVRGVLVQHEREYLLGEPAREAGPLALAAVDEDVVLARVGVQVAVHGDAALLHQPAYHELRVPDRGIALAHHRPILPVQVLARQGATIVADYHAVRVQHWHQLEDEALAELLGGKGFFFSRSDGGGGQRFMSGGI